MIFITGQSAYGSLISIGKYDFHLLLNITNMSIGALNLNRYNDLYYLSSDLMNAKDKKHLV